MSEEVTYHIYTLIDPRNNLVFYVGKTIDAVRRFQHHCYDCDNDNREKQAYIQDIKQQGLKPVLHIVETTIDKQRANEAERYWTGYYWKKGAPLTNIHFTPRASSLALPLIKNNKEKAWDSPSREIDGYYRFTPEETQECINCYRHERNINRVLQSMGKGARYRFDLRRIIEEAGFYR